MGEPTPPPTRPGWTSREAPPSAASLASPTPFSPLERFLGGSPANVALRLFFVSLIVGALFMWLDVTPADLWRGVTDLVNRMSRLGFDAVHEVFNYVLVGAAVVLPVWLILRLLDMRRDR